MFIAHFGLDAHRCAVEQKDVKQYCIPSLLFDHTLLNSIAVSIAYDIN